MKAGFLPGLIFLILVGILGRGLFLHPQSLPSPKIGKMCPDFSLSTLSGGVIKSSQLPAQYILLNVWASWCHACEEEQPFLMKLAQTGLPIYGMNYKDKPEEAKQWLSTWGNPYRAVGVDSTGEIGMELGVYGTPETFLINPEGKIILRYPGVLTQKVWDKEFKPLMVNKA